jgi:hypothetical protein
VDSGANISKHKRQYRRPSPKRVISHRQQWILCGEPLQ